jgi:hypothetical protein
MPQMLGKWTRVEPIMQQGDAAVSFIWHEEDVRGIVHIVGTEHGVPAMKPDWKISVCD